MKQQVYLLCFSALLLGACFGKKPLSKRLFYEKTIMDFGLQNPELISYIDPPLLDRFWNYKAKLN